MKERASRAIIRNAIKGLVMTAKEMACQTSVEDAQDEINRMKDMAVELADYWNVDDDVEEMFADALGEPQTTCSTGNRTPADQKG